MCIETTKILCGQPSVLCIKAWGWLEHLVEASASCILNIKLSIKNLCCSYTATATEKDVTSMIMWSANVNATWKLSRFILYYQSQTQGVINQPIACSGKPNPSKRQRCLTLRTRGSHISYSIGCNRYNMIVYAMHVQIILFVCAWKNFTDFFCAWKWILAKKCVQCTKIVVLDLRECPSVELV